MPLATGCGCGSGIRPATPAALGYVRGKSGTVVRVDGIYSVPDVEAHGTARRHEPTYSIRFEPAELWRDGQRGVGVHVDLWDSYLEPS